MTTVYIVCFIDTLRNQMSYICDNDTSSDSIFRNPSDFQSREVVDRGIFWHSFRNEISTVEGSSLRTDSWTDRQSHTVQPPF